MTATEEDALICVLVSVPYLIGVTVGYYLRFFPDKQGESRYDRIRKAVR